MAKLTQNDVYQIIDYWEDGHIKGKELAKMFGVSPATISNIVRGKVWTKKPVERVREPERKKRTKDQIKKSLDERLWSKAKREDECLVWQAGLGTGGYGRIYIHKKGQRQAHRVVWELANGPIPEGAFVLHSCDNRRCIELAHLSLGDAKENARQRDARSPRCTRCNRCYRGGGLCPTCMVGSVDIAG